MCAAAMTEERVYTTKEVARIIRANNRTVLRMIERGEIEFFRVGSQYRIRQSALDIFMAHKGESPGETEKRDLVEV